MKIKIPRKHFFFYQKLYRYLNETLLLDNEGIHSKSFSEKLIANYLKNSLEKKNGSGNGFEHKIVDEEQVGLKVPPVAQKKESDLKKRHRLIHECVKCPLGRKERAAIPNEKKSSIMILNDIPSFYEQMQGEYFQDKAGQLFKKILKALNIDVKKVYFTSAIKCASTFEMDNQLNKVSVCLEHLMSELNIIQPKLILAFGKNIYRLLFEKDNFASIRGQKLKFREIDVVFTYHPRDLLLDEQLKKDCWNDLKPYLSEINSLL